MPHTIGYRPDIDGLRCLAVAGVVLFHTQLGLPGGYVGVDMFFVVSGFLITSIISRQVANETFSMTSFLDRRCRRLLPALVVVLLVCLTVGWFVFLPEKYGSFGAALFSHSVFASNIFFWRTSGYLDASSNSRPLLHLWSLSVEEQFYLLYPLCFYWISRIRAISLPFIVFGCWAVSLAGCVVLTTEYPNAAFFLLPTRAWEMLTGCLIALVPNKRLGSGKREALSAVGLAMAVGSMMWFDEATSFPGHAALVPCVGTGLFIWANTNQATLVGRCVGSSPLMFLGRISYSVYLWHWPLIVVAHYFYREPLSLWFRCVLVGASLAIGYCSYLLVETPVRNLGKQIHPRSTLLLSAVVVACMGTIGATLACIGGVPSRFEPTTLHFADENPRYVEAQAGRIIDTQAISEIPNWRRVSPSRRVDFLLWGDSHARALQRMLSDRSSSSGVLGATAVRSGTPPLLGVSTEKDGSRVKELNGQILNFVKNREIKHVILVARWEAYVEPRGEYRLTDSGDKSPINLFSNSIMQTIATLNENGVTVWIVKQVPRHRSSVPDSLALAAHFGRDRRNASITVAQHRHMQLSVNEVLDKIHGARIMDPGMFLMDGSRFRLAVANVPLYADDNHLSQAGAFQVSPMFDSFFEEVAERHHPTAIDD